MAQKFTNNAVSVLASAISSSDTTIIVPPGDGAKFPTTDTIDDYFYLTLIQLDGTLEIVKCTGRTGDTFAVERAQDGTSAKAFGAGDRVELRFVAASYNAIAQESGQAYISVNAHLADTDNPHSVTKAQVGLGNVENYPVASPGEAASGAANRYMTAERTLGLLSSLGFGGNLSLISNLNASNTKPGIYRFESTTTGTKPSGMASGNVVVFGSTTGTVAAQLALSEEAKTMAVRFYDSSAWSSWRPVHIGNQTVSTSDPSGGEDGDIWYQV